MTPEQLTLNIAVNLGRLARWAMEGKENRIGQFIVDTEYYIDQLEHTSRKVAFEKTFQIFKSKFTTLKSDIRCDTQWAEEMLTWANILTHRAKLA